MTTECPIDIKQTALHRKFHVLFQYMKNKTTLISAQFCLVCYVPHIIIKTYTNNNIQVDYIIIHSSVMTFVEQKSIESFMRLNTIDSTCTTIFSRQHSFYGVLELQQMQGGQLIFVFLFGLLNRQHINLHYQQLEKDLHFGCKQVWHANLSRAPKARYSTQSYSKNLSKLYILLCFDDGNGILQLVQIYS